MARQAAVRGGKVLRPNAAPAVLGTGAAAAAGSSPSHGTNVRRLRIWKRKLVRIPACLRGSGSAVAVVVRDMSRHGAGLIGVIGSNRDEAVTLEFGNGRSIAARVRWRIGMRAGLVFIAPLGDGDPLIDGRLETVPVAAPRFAPIASRTPSRMMMRACREQGFAWLASDDGDD